jgi:anthranilate phosphoribosyltransferase
VTHAEFTPEDFGIRRSSLHELKGGDAAENASIIRQILAGEPGPRRDAALINAAPALVAAGLAPGFVEAVDIARNSIDSGAAAALLDRVVDRSTELAKG